jgi:hypothetical protein
MDLSQLYMLEMMRKRRLADTFPAYRTDDLVLMLDGIKNQRSGGHNPSATVWEDLAGNMDVTLYNAMWGADHAAFTGAYNSYGVGAKWTFTKGNTIEIVLRKNKAFNSSHGALVFSFNYIAGSGLRLMIQPDDTNIITYLNGAGVPIGTALAIDKVSYFGVSQGVAIQRGTTISHTGVSGTGEVAANLLLAAQWSDSSQTTVRSDLMFPGNIYAVRVYDANLTAEELYAHWLIDKARFNIPEE